MKKYILFSIAILAVAAVAVWNVSLNSQSNKLSGLSLANVEALAGEAFPYESIGCRTDRCDFVQGNWHTSSVKRTCYVKNDGQYSSCTPVDCGDVFYGCN